jgi:D-amino peptidase
MRHFVITDLEGVAGTDSFAVTRGSGSESKAPAMDQLGREVNACIEGIHASDPDADVTVWDGHGSGGLRESDVDGATYLGEGNPYYELEGFDATYFVGQHAMAGTVFAPLNHTYSSTSVAYYRLNDVFVGEFGCRALVAGMQDVPTVLLTGDDQACREADMFVPGIETVAVKRGRGIEAADHMDQGEAVDAVRAGAARAVDRIDEIEPFEGFDAPYELEIRYRDPVADERSDRPGHEYVDPYTVRIVGENPIVPDDPIHPIF